MAAFGAWAGGKGKRHGWRRKCLILQCPSRARAEHWWLSIRKRARQVSRASAVRPPNISELTAAPSSILVAFAAYADELTAGMTAQQSDSGSPDGMAQPWPIGRLL
jgi:hypothetical protein